MAVQRTIGTHWVARLIPPRPSFSADMTEDERALMSEHADYWQTIAAGEPGRVVVYGPVASAAGAWGLLVIAAVDADAATALVAADPAVQRGLLRPELSPMAVTLIGA
jgi:uncharacterized protein YciI